MKNVTMNKENKIAQQNKNRDYDDNIISYFYLDTQFTNEKIIIMI